MSHILEPWQQLGITEEAYSERQKIALELAAPQDVPDNSKPSKPERKTITVDLTDCPEVYARIKQLAEADDRTLAMWLKRYLRKEHGAAVTK
jgi:hypothetical protein